MPRCSRTARCPPACTVSKSGPMPQTSLPQQQQHREGWGAAPTTSNTPASRCTISRTPSSAAAAHSGSLTLSRTPVALPHAAPTGAYRAMLHLAGWPPQAREALSDGVCASCYWVQRSVSRAGVSCIVHSTGTGSLDSPAIARSCLQAANRCPVQSTVSWALPRGHEGAGCRDLTRARTLHQH